MDSAFPRRNVFGSWSAVMDALSVKKCISNINENDLLTNGKEKLSAQPSTTQKPTISWKYIIVSLLIFAPAISEAKAKLSITKHFLLRILLGQNFFLDKTNTKATKTLPENLLI